MWLDSAFVLAGALKLRLFPTQEQPRVHIYLAGFWLHKSEALETNSVSDWDPEVRIPFLLSLRFSVCQGHNLFIRISCSYSKCDVVGIETVFLLLSEIPVRLLNINTEIPLYQKNISRTLLLLQNPLPPNRDKISLSYCSDINHLHARDSHFLTSFSTPCCPFYISSH